MPVNFFNPFENGNRLFLCKTFINYLFPFQPQGLLGIKKETQRKAIHQSLIL